MLTAILLQLRALHNCQLEGGHGRAVHGFWLHQWQTIDPAFSQQLHQPQLQQPFTLSPLLGLPYPQHGRYHITAGQTAWLRITSLDAYLSQQLLHQWLIHLPAYIQLANSQWAVEHIALSPHEHAAAGQTSYHALQAAQWRPATQWTLTFHTPTTFRDGDHNLLPFPLPDSLVGSWLRRWQQFAPASCPPPPETWRQQLRQGLKVAAYDLKTVPVRHGRRLEIGCVGHIGLNGRGLPDDLRAWVNLLAHYAFYCGSGRHTSQGLGQTDQPIAAD